MGESIGEGEQSREILGEVRNHKDGEDKKGKEKTFPHTKLHRFLPLQAGHSFVGLD